MANIPTTAKGQFFSQKNEMMLQNLLTDDFKRRIGNDLNDKETTRLTKTIEHYMKKVYDDPANSTRPVQVSIRKFCRRLSPISCPIFGDSRRPVPIPTP